jgi:hypothetical protein
MAQNNNTAAAQAAGAAGASLATELAPRGRVVFLNALPLNALPSAHLELDVLPINVFDLAQWVQRRLQEGYALIHYIRHPATIATLRALGVSLSGQAINGLYSYEPGDIMVVVALRSPARGQEQTQVQPEELDVRIVTVL